MRRAGASGGMGSASASAETRGSFKVMGRLRPTPASSYLRTGNRSSPIDAYVHTERFRRSRVLTAADSSPLLEPPGFLLRNYGRGTPIATLLAHVVYGAIAG